MDKNLQPIIGTNFELFLYGDKVQNVTEFKTTYQLEEKEWRACGDTDKHSVTIGKKGTGNLATHKVDSKFLRILIDEWNKLINPSFYMAGILDSKDDRGQERVEYYGVKFNQIDIQNIKVDDFGLINLPFTFEHVEITDYLR